MKLCYYFYSYHPYERTEPEGSCPRPNNKLQRWGWNPGNLASAML